MGSCGAPGGGICVRVLRRLMGLLGRSGRLGGGRGVALVDRRAMDQVRGLRGGFISAEGSVKARSQTCDPLHRLPAALVWQCRDCSSELGLSLGTTDDAPPLRLIPRGRGRCLLVALGRCCPEEGPYLPSLPSFQPFLSQTHPPWAHLLVFGLSAPASWRALSLAAGLA